jgi:hypothetical protein
VEHGCHFFTIGRQVLLSYLCTYTNQSHS